MRGDSDESMLNKIFLGEVASVQNYGAFIRIPGGNNQGLVHRTQISSVNVPDASEVLAKDDRVWCKVISINPDGKIALSMKVVDQGNGKDLDPNGVQIRLDEQKRKEWVPGGQRKVISLEAVYNTTCSKCGTKGHLGKDCFQAAGGKTYELLTEEDDPDPETPAVQNSVVLSDEKKLKKKEKKEAKKIKKAKKKLKKALKKQKKKEKKLQAKRKKQKKSSSESSSDSSSDSSSESEDDKKMESHGNPPKRKPKHSPSSSRSPSPNKHKRHHPSPSKYSHVSKVRSVSKSRSPSLNSERKPQSRSPERSARSHSPHKLPGSKLKKRSR